MHITEMSDEEREKVLGNCPRSRESYNRCMSEGLYNDCSRDICKEIRDAEDKHKHDTDAEKQHNDVTEYCSILQTQNQHLESKLEELKNKNNELESVIIKHKTVVAR